MIESGTVERDDGPPLVLWLGTFLCLAMIAISISGLLFRLHAGTIIAAVLAAGAACLALRRTGSARLQWRSPALWMLPLVALPAAAALAPPYTWDEVAYGAALPRDYARAGSFYYNADYGPWSAFPSNFEALTTASIVLFGSVIPANLLNVALAFGLAAVAYSLCRELRLTEAAAVFSGVLVLSAPSLLGVASVVKNDMANGFAQGLFLLALTCYRSRPRALFMGMAGLFLGAAVGIKYSSLVFAACAVPLALSVVLSAASPPAKRRHVAVFVLIFFVSAAPWYARNVCLFGNPMFPFLNDLLGSPNAFTAEHSAILRDMIRNVPSYSWASGTSGEFLRAVFQGFGGLSVVLAVPGALISLFGRERARTWPIGVFFLACGLVTLRFGLWEPRYFLSLLALGAVLTALALERGSRALLGPGRARVQSLALLGVTVSAAVYGIAVQRSRDLDIARDVLRLGSAAFTTTHVPFLSVAKWLNTHATGRDRIGVSYVQPFYYLERPYFHIHPVSEKGHLQEVRNGQDLLGRLRVLGVTMLVVRQWKAGEEGPSSVLTPHLKGFWLRLYGSLRMLRARNQIRPVATFDEIVVFRIQDAEDAHAAAARPSNDLPRCPPCP